MRVNTADPGTLSFHLWLLETRARAGRIGRVLRAAPRWILRMAQHGVDLARNRIWRKRMSYRHLFLTSTGAMNEAAKIVLADLARFCNATTTTMVRSPITQTVDPFATGLAEGRRQVWLLVQKHLGVSDADIMAAMAQEQASYE